MDYVVGFLFTPDNHVVLIRKLRPKWQEGLLNGVGGKIEPKETPKKAMIREFREETGLEVKDWGKVLVMHCPGYNLHVFKARTTHITPKVESKTDEQVGIYSMEALRTEKIVPNLSWLIPLMLHDGGYSPFTIHSST